MTRLSDILLTAVAPMIWGSTYIVTTELLPQGYPLTVAMIRALPTGLLLLLFVRQLPKGIWWARVFLLGGLNFSFFLTMLFISAYRLPGGVAATVGAIQPLIVILLSKFLLDSPVRALAIVGGLAGMVGVALLVLTPQAALDPVGVVAGMAGAISMAAGVVLSRRWQPPVAPLTFTAWQMTAGGLLLVPVALLSEPAMPSLTLANWLRLIPSWTANKLIRSITGVHIHDYGCGLKLYRAEIVKQVRIMGGMHRFIPAWVASVVPSARIGEMVVNHHARQFGTSKYGISRTFRVILDLLAVLFFMRFRARPGHFFGSIGLAFGGISAVMFLYLFVLKFIFGESIGTRPMLTIAMMLFIGSVQMITTGILAEMLARTQNGTTSYVVRKTYGRGD